MHCLSSLEVGQRVPDLRLLSNDSEDLPDAKSEHEIVRTLNWFIEKISREVCQGLPFSNGGSSYAYPRIVHSQDRQGPEHRFGPKIES